MEFRLNHEFASFIDVEHILGTFAINEPIEQFIKLNTSTYLVRKHDQRIREITVPSLKLKNIQKWILGNILEKADVSDSAHGFVKGKSIKTNVQSHIHKLDSWLLRIDIKSFFPSICGDSVIRVFKKLGYSDDISKTLSMLCTKNGTLCQGFPTSPALANIFMFEFDNKLNDFINELASSYDLVYTRYADDIIVSGLKIKGYTKIVNILKDKIKTLLTDINLEINERKTSVQKKKRKKITGLYIEHDKIILPKSYLKTLESEIYYCRKFGILGHLRYHNMLEIANFKGYMYGKVAFIKMIDPLLAEGLKKKLDSLEWEHY